MIYDLIFWMAITIKVITYSNLLNLCEKFWVFFTGSKKTCSLICLFILRFLKCRALACSFQGFTHSFKQDLLKTKN